MSEVKFIGDIISLYGLNLNLNLNVNRNTIGMCIVYQQLIFNISQNGCINGVNTTLAISKSIWGMRDPISPCPPPIKHNNFSSKMVSFFLSNTNL